MFDPQPLIRPIIKDPDDNSEHAVWFLLEEVDGTNSQKTGMSKSTGWLKNHMVITNVDHKLVVPIMVTRAEFEAYFLPEPKGKPAKGLDSFLRERYERQQPEAMTFGEAKKSTIQMRAHYHPFAQQVSTQKYIRQPVQGGKGM